MSDLLSSLRSCRHSALAVGALSLLIFVAVEIVRGDSPSADPFQSRPAARLQSGSTVIDSGQHVAQGVLLFVRGELTAGDTGHVSDTVRYYAELFNLVYAAQVSGSVGQYRLDDVVVGYASQVAGRSMVVTADTAQQHGLRLNVIGRSVLAANEKTLDAIQVIARHDTSVLLDSPVFFRHQDRNQPMVLRFFVWVSPADGKLGAVVWLLEKVEGGYRLYDSQLNYIRPGQVERAVLHVEGGEFTLGIPSPQAFALTALPKGVGYAMTEGLAECAASERFDAASYRELAAELAATLGQK